jgi:hypothetical protein
VNIGGNETGQQSNFQSKGTRPQDAVWTMDGVNITDMSAARRRATTTTTISTKSRCRRLARTSSSPPAVGLNLIVSAA